MSGARLLFVIDGLSGGGTERSLVELLPFLRQEGFDILIVPLTRRTDAETEALLEGFEVRPLPPGGRLRRIWKLRNILTSHRPHLLHTMLFRSHMLGRFAALGTGIPVLSSLVNTPYAPSRYRDPSLRRWKLELLRRLDAWTSRHATTHFHAVSHAVADAAVEALGIRPERITLVERGRDTRRLGEPSPQRRRHQRERLGLTASDELVVQVGRQEFQKGQEILLRAAALLKHRPHLKVWIAGRSGHATAGLQRLEKDLQLADRIRFLGHFADVPDLLAAADVFAFPSRFEGMPGAVLEAMALGLPIAASDIPPVREIVEPGGNALLTPPEDPSRLAASLETLLDDPDRAAAFGARSRSLFLERFTLENSAAGMVALYRDLLGPSSSPGALHGR